jgi:hypothetical protein
VACEKGDTYLPYTYSVRSLTHVTQEIWGGATFIFVTLFASKIKLKTFFNERGNISYLRVKGKFTTHLTESARMISALSMHDEIIINTILKHKTLHYKQHTNLQIITTQSVTPLEVQCSSCSTYCLVSCPNVSELV